MDLRSVADELYSLPPSEFVAARNARATEARSGGDRTLADEIRALSKPSASAWAINLLVRERSEEVEQVVELGGALREAQDGLDRAALTSLSQQKRRVVGALARQAVGLSAEHSQKIPPTALREIEQTLSAAMADPDAAAAVQTGRLLRSLESLGFEPVDLVDAVAVPTGGKAAPLTRSGAGTRAPVNLSDRWAERAERAERARADARDAVGAADRLVDEADAEREALERRLTDILDTREDLATELDELQAQIDAIEKEVASLDRDARALERERGRADRSVEQARRRAASARERLDRLS